MKTSQRKVCNKEGITEGPKLTTWLVLAPHTKLFNRVFAAAQKILRETFGMELVELPSRTWLEDDAADGTKKLQS